MGIFDGYLNTFSSFEMILRKKELEETLNKMWSIYKKGNTEQIIEYEKQKDEIKQAGGRIFRNSQGEHKIVFKE